VNNEKLEQLLSKWNVDPEDLEDLFIWFSDMGYEVRIRVDLYGVFSPKYKITISIENIKDLYSREIEIEARKIIRGLTKLGLHCLSPARNQHTIIFVISKA
jgi:hypothetical protein